MRTMSADLTRLLAGFLLGQGVLKTCLVYLDDVIIFSKNVDEHIQHVDEVLTILRNAGISLKLR